ncbi:restriction endonuclease subunit S [Stomatobaculum longum]|uniref:restriction endonuclease subunit S n=1 Tax=Stomatobaculum longum TaxID=796942 RepID=UPI003C70739D
MAERRVPRIRFKGFEEDWEQRKLGEICSELRSGEFISAEDITEYGAIPVYGGNGLRGYTSKYNREGEFALIGRQGALCGNMNFSRGKAYFTEHAVITQANSDNDTLFLFYCCDNMNLGQYSDQSAQPGLAVGKLAQLLVRRPCKIEQEKIAKAMSVLDSLLSLHQRKLEKLKILKKAMLEKMFPKNGAKVPEIRFSGFTDDWEQRKFNELYERNDERNNGQFGQNKTISISTMTFNELGNGAADSSIDFYKVLRLGDIAFEGHTNKEFRYGRFGLNDIGNGIMSPRFTTLRPITKQEFTFWKYYIHDERVMRQKLVRSTKAGTMMNELVIDDLMRQSILVPSLSEQKKTGDYFKGLDHLLSLHQRKLEKLRQIKKSMLERMFV